MRKNSLVSLVKLKYSLPCHFVMEFIDSFPCNSAENLINLNSLVCYYVIFLLLSLSLSLVTGTKWCGTGDIAETYSDLGSEMAMDRCCRQHDLCPVKIRAYQNKYELMNDSLYTKWVVRYIYNTQVPPCTILPWPILTISILQIALHMWWHAFLVPEDDKHIGIATNGLDILQSGAGALPGWT